VALQRERLAVRRLVELGKRHRRYPEHPLHDGLVGHLLFQKARRHALLFIIAYDLWNFEYTYNNLPTHAWYCGLALLLAPTFANALWNKGGWIQNRANTLALWCMFAQVFPLFQDASVFTTIPVLYADGFMDAAVRPSAADPTMQGVVAILALAANVIVLAVIIKRSLAQKKNPYTGEIFTDTRDFQLAMARAEGK